MKLFLDTEFNGFKGPLISLALVPSKQDQVEFYEVLPWKKEDMNHWCQDNVFPILGKEPVEYDVFKDKLWSYLKTLMANSTFGLEIYADWPEDISHLCNLLCMDNGKRMGGFYEMQFILIDSGKCFSKIPHNALEDAKALRDWYFGYTTGNTF